MAEALPVLPAPSASIITANQMVKILLRFLHHEHQLREELQRLFHRGSSFTQLTPQFQQRTIWGPTLKKSTARKGKKNPDGRSAKGKNVKKSTFAREVVLIRHLSDSLVRGGAKAELQRLGNVMSSFEFDKGWSATEFVAELEEAFSSKLAYINSTPK